MRFANLAIVLGLMGCSGDKGDDSAGVCNSCDCVEHPDVIDNWPADGATGVYHRTRLFVDLKSSDYDSAIVLTDGSGAEVTGTSSFDNGLTMFEPGAPLTPGDSYTMQVLTNDCEGESFSFETSDVGAAPVADLNSLIGRTWRISLSDGKPPPERDGLQAVIDMVEEDLLITAVSLNAETIDALVGSTFAGVDQPQDMCVPSTSVSLSMAANPYATGTVPVGYAPLQGEAIPTFGGDVSGTFSSDGSTLAGIDLTMIQDMDAAGVIIGDDLCALLPQLGVFCEDCPSGSGNCLDFNVWGIDGSEDMVNTAVVVTEADVAGNPACAK